MTRLVIFDLNGLTCAIDALKAFEIINYQNITKLPGLPAHFEGMVSLRGAIVPVIDLNERFGLTSGFDSRSQADNPDSKIIISEVLGQKIGFIVNSVREIALYDDSDIKEVPDVIKSEQNKYLKGILLLKDKGIIVDIVDLNTILDESELTGVGML